MAVIFNNQNYPSSNSMGLPLNIKRGNPAALDHSSTWTDWAKLQQYAQTDPIAYVGQVVTFYGKKAETDESAVCEAYIIADEGGTLVKLASTTASGDLASDVVTLQSKVTALENAVGKAGDGTAEDPATGLYALIAAAQAAADAAQSAADAAQDDADAANVAIGTRTAGGTGTVYGDIEAIEQNLSENYYDKDAVDGKLSGALHFKGTKTYKSELPTSGQVQGDVWLVTYDIAQDAFDAESTPVANIEYAWTGTAWEALGGIEDLSSYATKEYADQAEADAISAAAADATTKAGTAESNAKGHAEGLIGDLGEDASATGFGGKKTVKKYVDDINTALMGNADTADSILGVKKAAGDAAAAAAAAQSTADDAASAAAAAQSTADSKVDKLASKPTAGTYTKVSINTEGQVTGGEGLAASDIPEIGMDKVSGLSDALAGKQDTVTFDGTYNAGTNKAATVKTVTDAVGAVVSNGNDTKTDNTIAGAKLYADDKAAAAQTAAEQTAANALSPVSQKADANETAITKLNGADTVDGSVAKKIKDAIANLDNDGQTVGTGEIIESVSQTDGVISVTKRALVKADIPTIDQSQVDGLGTALSGKQDTVVWNTAYDAANNKAATMRDVTDAVAGLSGAMHYIGDSSTDPTTESGATIDGVTSYARGDVVTFEHKEYVFDGSAWRQLGDEQSYAVKGAIKNADIASDAAIDQSKISGLPDALSARLTGIKLGSESDVVAVENGVAKIPVATADKLGVVKSSADTVENAVKVNPADGTMEVTKLNISKLVQTDGEFLILDGGDSNA